MLIVSPKGKLTSYVFYNDVVKQLHGYFQESKSERIVFDFSDVSYIDSLVLPNLLCVGYWIVAYFSAPAKIYIPSSLQYAHLKTFLYKSNFIKIAQQYNLFEFDEDIEGGLLPSSYNNSVNRICVFSRPDDLGLEARDKDISREIEKKVYQELKPFWNEFLEFTDIGGSPTESLQKMLGSFCVEMIDNAILSGRSFCFLGLQYNSDKRIKIAISDCGIGFMNSINEKRDRSLLIKDIYEKSLNHVGETKEIHELMQRSPELENWEDVERISNYPEMTTEAQGIIYGLLSRICSKRYGLFNVFQKIRKLGGIIRVHSNDTRLVFSENMDILFSMYQEDVKQNENIEREIPQRIYQGISTNQRYRYNYLTNLKFRGTHIELEFSKS